MILCDKCNAIPTFSLINQETIQINCVCQFKKTISVQDFVMKYQSNTIDDTILNKVAKEININMFYCKNCLCYFNNAIIANHSKHQYVNLCDCFDYEKLENALTLYKEAHNHINKYNKEILNDIISSLENKISEIKAIYEHNKTINDNLLKYSEFILNSCIKEPSNYNIIRNFLSNTLFNINQCTYTPNDISTPNIDTVINYYNTEFILGIPKVDLSSKLKAISTIKPHNGSICSMVILKDGRLATSSVDKNISILNLSSFQIDFTISNAHHQPIFYINQLFDGNLITCSSDRTIKIWKISLNSYESLATILGHPDSILKVLPLSKNRFCSCSEFGYIKIWNSNPPYDEMIHLKGQSSAVMSAIQLKGRELLVSGSYDQTIKFWNLSTYKNEHTIKGAPCVWRNALIEIDNNRIVSGGSGKVTIVNTITYQIEAVIATDKNIQRIFSMIKLRDGSLLCGCENGWFYQIDMKKYKFKFIKEKMHEHNILSLFTIDQMHFISSSYDKSIKKWNY